MSDATDYQADGVCPLPATMVLAPVLDLTVVQDLKTELTEKLSAESPLVLDASKVEKIGSAAIQLLHAASVACDARARDMTVIQPSAAFVQGVTDIGFADDLETWSINR